MIVIDGSPLWSELCQSRASQGGSLTGLIWEQWHCWDMLCHSV